MRTSAMRKALLPLVDRLDKGTRFQHQGRQSNDLQMPSATRPTVVSANGDVSLVEIVTVGQKLLALHLDSSPELPPRTLPDSGARSTSAKARMNRLNMEVEGIMRNAEEIDNAKSIDWGPCQLLEAGRLSDQPSVLWFGHAGEPPLEAPQPTGVGANSEGPVPTWPPGMAGSGATRARQLHQRGCPAENLHLASAKLVQPSQR